jgi:hypothetical protein
MPQLVFNGNLAPINPALHCWQDLLAELESRQLGANDVIASVHFDGDEVVEFRGSEALTMNLSTIDEVRVTAMGREEVAREAIAQAESYLRSLESAAVEVAEMFRCHKVQQANAGLQELLTGIKMYVGLLRGIDLSLSGAAASTNDLIDQLLNPMATTLEEQIKAQAKQDWMLVADILEYEVAAQLTGFESILTAFKSHSGVCAR